MLIIWIYLTMITSYSFDKEVYVDNLDISDMITSYSFDKEVYVDNLKYDYQLLF